jgi:small subunit ribosomal protein S13
MARIAGVDIPDNKRGEIALTYIFGIGRSAANHILAMADVDKNKKVAIWTDAESQRIRNIINENYKIEDVLRSTVRLNIKRLVEIGCYRGRRHVLGLPIKGRTKANARTKKGKRKTVANKKKAAKK